MTVMIRALLIFIVASSLPNFSPLLSAQGFECSRPWPIIASPSLLASRPRSPATTLLITENMKTESVYCLHSITRFFADKHFRFLLEELGGRGVGGARNILWVEGMLRWFGNAFLTNRKSNRLEYCTSKYCRAHLNILIYFTYFTLCVSSR